MPNFTAPGQEARYQGTNAELIIGRIIPPPGVNASTGVSGSLLFVPDATYDIGSADGGATYFRPNRIWAAAQIQAGLTASDPTVIITSPAGSARHLAYRTNGVPRWDLNANATAEGGADAGSDFVVNAYTDAGVLIDVPITITRAAGGAITVSFRPLNVGLGGGGADNSTVNVNAGLTGRPLIQLQRNTVTFALWGISTGPGVLAAGSVSGDSVFRNSQSILFTADGGITTPVVILAAGLQIQVNGAAGVTSGLCVINQVNQAGASAGTLTNAPAVGNPTFWIPVNVNGALKKVPAW